MKKNKFTLATFGIVCFSTILLASWSYFDIPQVINPKDVTMADANASFGWKFPMDKFPMDKFPIAKLPSTGSGGDIAYSSIRQPGATPTGFPVSLNIPTIGVDSIIEDALITPDGKMDVPSGSVNVAWFSLGPHPGDIGSAVIGGHFGISGGVPFVFYNLDKLKIGDKVFIVNDKKKTLEFIVRSIRSLDQNADATNVFTSNDGLAHLNLITCEGIWNKVNDTYPQRLVVFTDQIPLESGVALSSTPVTFSRTFGLGASGDDVVALQTFLVRNGFLVIPEGTPKGHFGGLTRMAVEKYQTSVGISAVGYFGPLTIAKLSLDLNNQLGSPAFPSAGLVENNTPNNIANNVSLNFTDLIKTLFSGPLNGGITFILLGLIGYVIFIISKRRVFVESVGD